MTVEFFGGPLDGKILTTSLKQWQEIMEEGEFRMPSAVSAQEALAPMGTVLSSAPRPGILYVPAQDKQGKPILKHRQEPTP